MAISRTETIQQVNAKIIPTVFPATHRSLLNVDLIDSIDFRKDVIGAETTIGGSVTVDYTDKDMATVVTTTNIAVTFANMANGDVKYLRITKNPGNTVSFTGAVDISQRKAFIDTTPTLVVYRVARKNLEVYVDAINIDNDENVSSLTGDTPKTLIVYENWNMNLISGVQILLDDILEYDDFISAEVVIRSNINNRSFPLLSNYVNNGFSSGNGGTYVVDAFVSGPNAGKAFMNLYKSTPTSAFDDPLFSSSDAYIYLKHD